MNKFRSNFKKKRLGDWLRVNYRFTVRKIKRFFKGEHFRRSVGGRYAKRLYAVLTVGVLFIALMVGAQFFSVRYHNTERLVLKKLTYGADYDASVPYFRTLHQIGSSNHLCVTVKTSAIRNISNRDVALTNGGVNLKLSFSDGSTKELSLKARHRLDAFSAGKQSDFIVTLPYGYTPFDITDLSLVLTAGSDGKYDSWSCDRASVSFMLGSERVLIAKESWSKPAVFGSGKDMLRSIALQDVRKDNATYQQMNALFSTLNALSEQGMTDFRDAKLKTETLSSLNISNATALYLDVETVSDRYGALTDTAPEAEELNYNGVLYVDITFHEKLEDGSYSKRYIADTPGKDDFELSAASTFRFEMPEGLSVFDIAGVSLSTSDIDDAWAPRFARLYIPLDFDCELEISRLTDSSLEQKYDTCIFYREYLDTPIAFDLNEQNSISTVDAARIEKDYHQTLSGNSYAFYFEKQSFLNRRILFYQQLSKIYVPAAEVSA